MKRLLAFSAISLALVGCLNPQSARLQSADENEVKEIEPRTIGQITTVASTEEGIPVVGVGLVTGLNGTGGGAPPASSFRDALEQELKKQGVQNIKGMLESPDNAMVIVTARVPAGTRRNDTIDIEVGLPEMSRCTSLKGGYLAQCKLFTFETTHNLSPKSVGPNQTLRGDAIMKAEGKIQMKFADQTSVGANSTDSEDSRSGQILGGGRCLIDPPITLLLTQNAQETRYAIRVAEQINKTFPGMRYGRDGLASPKNNKLVIVGVPMQYRHDPMHFQRVLRAIPLDNMNPQTLAAYRRQLADRLLDPVKSQGAAIRLEALGEESVPILRQALACQYPISRFSAAQALTYLRKRDGVEELVNLARQQPALRALCLTALASLDESICHTRLADLLAEPDAELRYGAFCSLRALDDRAPEVAGERCGDAFWLHQVAPDSMPMVHYMTHRRAEIVLFGRPPVLMPDLRVLCGDFSFIVGNDGTCTVKRYLNKGREPLVKQCPAQLADVLKTLGEMGGSYSDAVDFLSHADSSHKLTCEVRHDNIPQLIDPLKLAKMAQTDPTLRTAMPAPTLARGQ
jgi:hypothetical protein